MWNIITLDGYFEGVNNWDLPWHEQVWGEELERFSLPLHPSLVGVFRQGRQVRLPGPPADGAQLPGLQRRNEPQDLVDVPSYRQVLHAVGPEEPVRIDEERPPQCGTESLQQNAVILRDLLVEIGEQRIGQFPEFLSDPRQMGKLAVRTDAEELGSFRREFALPPGELEDFRISDGSEIQRVEDQDDPGPLVVGQLDLPERRPHDR